MKQQMSMALGKSHRQANEKMGGCTLLHPPCFFLWRTSEITPDCLTPTLFGSNTHGVGITSSGLLALTG